MNTYSVRVYPPGAFNGWYATVTAKDRLPGVGYGRNEREAVTNAWREYWRKLKACK